MSTHKHIDIICCVVLVFTLTITVLFMNAGKLGVEGVSIAMDYETTLFDTSKVHTIDILMDDWEEFTENCKSEEYYACTLVIDHETFQNVAIRGKGNTSLSQVTNGRYSYKVEFDHYNASSTYHGLDKLCLNNIIQDNTYMKDYLTFQMMKEMEVATPLCSYAYLTVNGEDWGLYLAVEGVEEAFLQRNYGNDYGELYKPDSMDMGDNRGNRDENAGSRGFGDFPSQPGMNREENGFSRQPGMNEDENGFPGWPGMNLDEIIKQGEFPNMPGMEWNSEGFPGNIGGGMKFGSSDVLLQYIDDNISSYSNIFDNAKTKASKSDKKRLIESLRNLSEGENIEDTVDVDEVIRYFVVHNFVLNFDSYTGSMVHNYYLYEKDGQLQMIPWDYNLAFGGFQSAGGATSLVNYPIDSPVSGGSIEDRPMISWIFSDEEYTEQYHSIFSDFLTKYFESGYFEEMIEEVEAMISPYVEKDPTKFCTYEEFKTGIATLKEFCLLRAESIRGQLEGTIGSTLDTQENDTLIDAGDLQINDMGSMANMGNMRNKSNMDNMGNKANMDNLGDRIRDRQVEKQ